jgi:hypothetical protein
MWSKYSIEYYSARTKNEMEVESIMLSKISQTQTSVAGFLSYVAWRGASRRREK